MEVQWRDLSVTIGQKRILGPCSGTLRPGRMVALMGPSGSGKTTFLSCLRQDIPHRGEVRFAGERFHPGLRQLIGFVEQDDVVLPPLTVRQSLAFLAQLRFGIGSPKAAARVEEVMASVRLGRIADSVVGEAGAAARISGGERKRLCIARELLGDPQLLICDEPTSGLDSTMAEQVVGSMRSLCRGGTVSVVASVHQPSAAIFASFDDLLLLREGQVLYWGPTADAEAFFTSRGAPRGPLQSTAEYLMDLLVLEEQGKPSDGCAHGGGGLSATALAGALDHARAEAAALPPLAAPLPKQPGLRRYEAPFSRQVLALTRRHALLLVDEVFSLMNLVQNLGLMLISSILWVRLDFMEADVHPRWGACLWTVGTWMFFPIIGGIATFPGIRRVLEKELRVGCYSLAAFYAARTLLLLPLELVWPTLWTTGFFWITNLNPHFWVFLQVMGLVWLSFTTFQGVGLAISASGMPPARGRTVSLLLITYFFAWNGFFVDLSRVPNWASWASKVNPFKYSVELMMHIILQGDVKFTCDHALVVGDLSKQGVACEKLGAGPAVLSGAGALKRHGITSKPWVCIVVLAAVLLCCRLLAFVLLRLELRSAIDGAQERPQPTANSPKLNAEQSVAVTEADKV